MLKKQRQMSVQNVDPKHKCRSCKKSFNSYIVNMHREKFAGVCICYKIYQNECEYEQHFQTSELPSAYKCCVCGVLFKRKRGLKVHFIEHGGWRKYACLYCKQEFPEFEELANHEFENSAESEYECKTCHIVFSRKCALLDHEFISKSEVLGRLSNGYTASNHQDETESKIPNFEHRITPHRELHESKDTWLHLQEQQLSTINNESISKSEILGRQSNRYATSNHQDEMESKIPNFAHPIPPHWEHQTKDPWIHLQDQHLNTVNKESFQNRQTYPSFNSGQCQPFNGPQYFYPPKEDFGLQSFQPQQLIEHAYHEAQKTVPNRSGNFHPFLFSGGTEVNEFTKLFYHYLGNHKALVPI